MEAATPLRQAHVRSVGDRVAVDGLTVQDETAVRLVRDREAAGDDAVKLVLDAIEIGARVLDREQTGADVELVKAQLAKAAQDTESMLRSRSAELADEFARKFDEAFGADGGHVAKTLERLFSDGSSAAVQHRIKDLVTEVMARSREDIARQFSAEDGSNPLAGFQKASLQIIKQASDQQDVNLRALHEKIAALEKELQGLRQGQQHELALDEERERGTAKGRPYEEAVFEALDAIAGAQGDDCEAVGDLKGTTRKTGDIVVAIDACRGPARGRVVFEAKAAKLSKPEAMRELDRGRAEREADYAVLVVSAEEKLPARTQQLREFNGDKLFAVYDLDEGSTLSLELAYRLARARVLMARGEAEGIDAAAIGETVERALGAMDDVRAIKQKLTGATTSIKAADELLGAMADGVRAQLARIDELLAAGDGDA